MSDQHYSGRDEDCTLEFEDFASLDEPLDNARRAEINNILSQLDDDPPVNQCDQDLSVAIENPKTTSPAQQLDKEELKAVEELDRREIGALRKTSLSETARERVRLVKAEAIIRQERHRRQNAVFRQAEAAAIIRIRTERKRVKDTERQRRHRASRDKQNEKRLERLTRATAKPNGNKFLEQLRGREITITRFYDVLLQAKQKFGPNVSGAKLAALYKETWSEPMDRFAALKYRNHVAKLEARGGPWYSRQGVTS